SSPGRREPRPRRNPRRAAPQAHVRSAPGTRCCEDRRKDRCMMANPFKARILVWPLILILLLLIGGGVFLAIKAPSLGSFFGTHTEESSSQVITSITRTEEVSLLSLGIQGIDSKKANSKVPFLGLDIPGSE